MKYASLSIRLAFLLSLLCISCKDDPVVQPQADPTMLRFTVVTADEATVDTRTGNEDEALQNVYVLIFNGTDENAIVTDWAKATSAGSATYYASLNANTEGGTMFILANIEYGMDGNIADLQKGGTLKEVKEGLLVKPTQKDGYIIQDLTHSPMVSEPQKYQKGAGEMTFMLTRSTAKVTVADESDDVDFELEGANMGNAPVKGYVFNMGVSITDVAHYAGQEAANFSLEAMMKGISSTVPKTTLPLFLFESPASNGTFVIIKGIYKGITGYHKLGLLDKGKQGTLGIKRNYQYIIHIKKVGTAGYATAAEAINNAPDNRVIDYDITVTESSSHDIITNGDQYLGVSNSSLIIYRTGDVVNMPALKLSYTVANNWQAGSITATGEGLFMSNGQKTISLANVAIESADVGITFNSLFKTGILTIRIGDLCKVISIKRYDNLAAVPNEMEFDGVTIGDCSESPIKNLIRFSETSGVYNSHAQDDVFVSSSQKIYSIISANIGYGSTLAERDGEFYVANAQDEGRTRVVFHQEKLDVYKGSLQIQPYTFVGVFHRWNQTAERIIRIKTLISDEKARWIARMIVGEDFIELDEHRSPDAGITIYPYGCKDIDNPNPSSFTDADHAQWTSDDEIEKNCQFTDDQKGKTMVSGSGQNVYFRVGMKSKLASADSQPRYGLIALNYMTSAGAEGTHLIYVRQGEEADYLMRPEDPVNTTYNKVNIYTGNPTAEVITIQLDKREEAVKILPYNITIPTAQNTQPYYDVPAEGGVLTSYPSQGGYFFKGNSNRGYFPVGTGSSVSFTSSGMDVDVCPAGYRKAVDGVANNTGYAKGSEMRLSFWLNPRNDMSQSSFDNALRGYIADGYYDRRMMRVPNTQGRQNEGVQTSIYTSETVNGTKYTVPTLVADGSEIGYAGMLLYNPYNYASIFIPANGSRTRSGYGMSGELRGTGLESNIWSSTYGAYGMWYLAIGEYSNKFVFDNYGSNASMEGLSIRCVKK